MNDHQMELHIMCNSIWWLFIADPQFTLKTYSKEVQGSTLALARLPGASKFPCRASNISKCSNLLAQSGK